MSSLSKRNLDALPADKITAVSSRKKPARKSLKRTFLEAKGEPTSMRMNDSTTSKKTCLLPVGARTTTQMSIDGGGMGLLTPPKSPEVAIKRTIRLKLNLRKQEVANESDKKPKSQVSALKKPEPKLKRPMPRKRAKKAPSNSHTSETTAPPEPSFIKLHINKSARVDKLLHAFMPLRTTPAPKVRAKPFPERKAEHDEQMRRAELIKPNQNITDSEFAKELAWEAFSKREKDRVDRGRQAMMVSGLEMEDLVKEMNREENGLPEWRKVKTGRFARRK